VKNTNREAFIIQLAQNSCRVPLFSPVYLASLFSETKLGGAGKRFVTPYNKTVNVSLKPILKRFRVTIFAVEKL